MELRKAKGLWAIGLLLLAVGCAQVSEISLPGFQYLSRKVSLDVAEVVVKVDFKAPQEKKGSLIPASLVNEMRTWGQTRFKAVGKKGRAVIRIKKAGTFQHGLKKADDIHVLLSSGGSDYFGAHVSVDVDVEDTPAYSTGGVTATLERKLDIDSGVKMAFRPRLWQQFVQNFMNSFDDQVLHQIKTHLPQLIAKKAS